MAPNHKTVKQQAEEAFEKGNLAEAEKLFREVLSNLEMMVGDHTFETAATLHCLARVLERLGRADESKACRDRADNILCSHSG